MKHVMLSAIFAGLCLLVFSAGAYAQTPDDYEKAYAEQAVKNIRTIEEAYIQARDFVGSSKGTTGDVESAWSILETLEQALMENEPPVAVLGIHQQILFTIQRCSNYVNGAGGVTDEARQNAFLAIMESQQREFCAVQINAAKLRLIDYGVANGVNLFTGLSAPIEITYTTPVTSTTPISPATSVFGRAVMAKQIGANNEPVEVTSSFSPTQDVIYVVVEADFILEGTTLLARWYRGDEPIEDSSELTADQNYRNTYVEFHLENLAGHMEPGDYRVDIYVDGDLAKQIDFTVSAQSSNAAVEQEGELIFGGISWTIESARNAGSEYDDPDDNFLGTTTSNVFVAVDFTIENTGNVPVDVQYGFKYGYDYAIILRDSNGRQFDPFEDGYVPEHCQATQLNPGLSKSCVILFEVPSGATDFSLVFVNEANEEQVVELDF